MLKISWSFSIEKPGTAHVSHVMLSVMVGSIWNVNYFSLIIVLLLFVSFYTFRGDLSH